MVLSTRVGLYCAYTGLNLAGNANFGQQLSVGE